VAIPTCLFASDLHGSPRRWKALFRAVRDSAPAAVFLGGDLLPNGVGYGAAPELEDWVEAVLFNGFGEVRRALGARAPRVFLILGNDDGRAEEQAFLRGESEGHWTWSHGRRVAWEGFSVYGYAYTPPSPFRLKDWEKYDVSRFVDPGCISPEEGWRSVPVSEEEARWGTIRNDLERLAGSDDLARAIFLFHAPPYRTHLDRAALDGMSVDHAPLDVHVGSIAVRRFLEARQPLLSLHGHVHESARITGAWRDRIGRTHCLGAAHDGPELALVRFDPEDPEGATRELL
jgi:Icc-related predicted phosphoesterase